LRQPHTNNQEFSPKASPCPLAEREWGVYKARGVPVAAEFSFIFTLLFSGKSLFLTLRDERESDSRLDKNVVYRFLHLTKTDRIHFTTVLALQILEAACRPQPGGR
jgi:hypothetical protein